MSWLKSIRCSECLLERGEAVLGLFARAEVDLTSGITFTKNALYVEEEAEGARSFVAAKGLNNKRR